MIRRSAVLFVLAFAGALYAQAPAAQPPQQSPPQQPPLKLASDVTIPIWPAAKTAQATLWIENTSASAVQLALSVGPFTIDATKHIVGGTWRLSGASSVPQHGRVPIVMTVEDHWPAGGATASILNDGQAIGTVHVTAFPFQVAPDGYKDGTPYALKVRQEETGRVMIVNPDPFPYTVRAAVWWPGANEYLEEFTIGPNSSRLMRIVPDKSWFPNDLWLASFLREPENDGVLSLSVVPSLGGTSTAWPVRQFRLKVTRAFHTDGWRSIGSTLILFCVLLAGAAVSLFLTNWVPNRSLKLQVTERLAALVGRVRNLSSRIGSELRVNTRVERLRILFQLESRWVASGDYPTLAKACDADVTRLENVVTRAEQIDDVYYHAYSTLNGFVPTLMKRAVLAGQKAEERLHGPIISDADLAAAQALITEAGKNLDGVKTLTTDFAQELAQRVASLAKKLQDAKVQQSVFLKTAFPDLGNIDAHISAGNSDPKNITQNNFAEIDEAEVKVGLLLKAAATIDGMSESDREAWADIIERMMNNLRSPNLSELNRAEMRVREITSRIREESVAKAINEGEFRIIVEPSKPKTGSTAHFRIEFNDRHIGNAAAKNELRCTWSFGDRLEESGFWVTHYYAAPGDYNLSVAFATEKASINCKTDAHKTVVEVFKVEKSRGYSAMQWIKFAVALFVAILGLLAGAADQLAKVDLIPGLIAVFMLGFSADQIKNVISK